MPPVGDLPDPALIFHDEADRAGTHVLLVGIGAYPWLEGGDQYVADEHEEGAMGMGQLAAPPISMRRMADWFLDGFDNPQRELASLSIVLSEAEHLPYLNARANNGGGPVPRGTIDEVRAAVAAWIRRSNGRRDNLLVFGFCGHGVQSGNPVLLCRDYGKDTEARFQGAIDFDQFRIALSTRQPDTQLLLVDACRTPDLDDLQLGQATPGNPLIDSRSLTTRDNAPAAQSIHFATSLYTAAWGRKEGASLFTDALLKALGGGAAEPSARGWVTTSRLHTALSTYLARFSAEEGVIQRPASQSVDFLLCEPRHIPVDVYVCSESEPGIWNEKIRIKASRSNFEGEFPYTPAKPPDPIVTQHRLELVNPTHRPADATYDVSAEFEAGSAFEDCQDQLIAYPPETYFDLPVRKRP